MTYALFRMLIHLLNFKNYFCQKIKKKKIKNYNSLRCWMKIMVLKTQPRRFSFSFLTYFMLLYFDLCIIIMSYGITKIGLWRIVHYREGSLSESEKTRSNVSCDAISWKVFEPFCFFLLFTTHYLDSSGKGRVEKWKGCRSVRNNSKVS